MSRLASHSILSRWQSITACGEEWTIRPLSFAEFAKFCELPVDIQFPYAVSVALQDAGMTAEQVRDELPGPLVGTLGSEIIRISKEPPPGPK